MYFQPQGGALTYKSSTPGVRAASGAVLLQHLKRGRSQWLVSVTERMYIHSACLIRALFQRRNADSDSLEVWNRCQALLFGQAMQATPLQAHLLTDVWSCLIRYIFHRAAVIHAAAYPFLNSLSHLSGAIASGLACAATSQRMRVQQGRCALVSLAGVWTLPQLLRTLAGFTRHVLTSCTSRHWLPQAATHAMRLSGIGLAC